MSTSTVSPKYQIVIPKDIRDELGIKPGERVALYVEGQSVRMLRVPPIKELRGFAKGLPPFRREREEDRW